MRTKIADLHTVDIGLTFALLLLWAQRCCRTVRAGKVEGNFWYV